MRTTVEIDDDLYGKAKRRALEEGKTLRDVVEAALREYIRPRPRPRFRLEVVTKKGRLRSGVDIDDRDSLYDVMEGRE